MTVRKVDIYTRPVDDDVWDWARDKATTDRTSLARVVADALRHYRNHTTNPENRTIR